MEAVFHFNFSKIHIHTNTEAAHSALKLGAAAYTAGNHIVFAPGQYAPDAEAGRHLLRHELAHVTQHRSISDSLPSTMNRDPASEHFADSWSNIAFRHPLHSFPLAPNAVMPSLASKIIQWAGKRLEKQTAKLISKHIARHARSIAGRAIHSIFRNPREIRALVKVTLKEAGEIAARHASAGTEHIVEEAGIRLTRQATGTPGKFRLVIEKVFNREIGTAGERVLRLVLDQTGRLVTAFPADRLLLLGLTVAGVEALTEGSAKAGEIVRSQAERQAAVKAREEEQSSSWWEWVPIIGDIWGGSLNVGEDEALRQDRERQQIDNLIKEIIDDLEKTEQRSFAPQRRQEIEDVIRTAISLPGLLEEAEEESEDQ